MILAPTCLITGNDAENLTRLFSRVSAGLGFLGSLMVKNLPANAGDTGWIREQGDPLEEGMATHSSTRAWDIPWT